MKKKDLKVILTVGLPASGKSTWTTDYIRRNQDTVRVGRDSFRYMLTNTGFCEPKIEAMITDLVETTIMSCLKRKLNVIVDNTHLKVSVINEIIRLVEYTADVEFMVFDVPAKVCIERDKLREKSVGEEVIKKLDESWQITRDSYGFQNLKRKPEWMRPTINVDLGPNEKPQAVIFDIDGTLALMHNRGPFDWEHVDRDRPNEIVMDLLRLNQKEGRKILLVSGRDESCRQMTHDWLEFYGVTYDHLFMREKDSMTKDSAVKKEIYERDIEPYYHVISVVDDRLQVLKAWNKLGLFTFNVNQGQHEF